MTAGNPVSITTFSARETAIVGRFLARSLRGSHVVALVGGLGSGKTVLAQAMAGALGIRRLIKSPTFVLIAGHRTRGGRVPPLFHIDCYRIKRLTWSDRAAIREAIETPGAVTLIEWADRIPSVIAHVPQRRLTTVRFGAGGADSRHLTVSGGLTGSVRKWGRADLSRWAPSARRRERRSRGRRPPCVRS